MDGNTGRDTAMSNVGVLIYTHNRVDDARVNLEIIRNVWGKSELLREATVVHAFNGEASWWPERYLEDDLLRLENPGHFGGAELLLNAGLERFATKHPHIDYVVVLASDTWCVKPNYVEKIITGMRNEKKPLAVCAWGTKLEGNMFKIGMSLDFFVVDVKWAMRFGLFPIRYREFFDEHAEAFWYEDRMIYLERVFALRFKQAVVKAVTLPSENLIRAAALEHVYRLVEREPVHHARRAILGLFGPRRQERRMYWRSIGLLTHHDPAPKQRALKEWDVTLGECGEKFLKATDLHYWNGGLVKIGYEKNGKKIGYGD